MVLSNAIHRVDCCAPTRALTLATSDRPNIFIFIYIYIDISLLVYGVIVGRIGVVTVDGGN